MIWSLLADLLVIIHFAFTAFVIFGGFLTWRWRRMVFAHLPALAWGIWVEVSHSICPLTPLENHFRHLGGEAGYGGSFLAHYLVRVLYPPGLTWQIQWALAATLIAINVIAYWGLLRRRTRSRIRFRSRP
jgi:membrane protein implicated in regulation of membrane protease activity